MEKETTITVKHNKPQRKNIVFSLTLFVQNKKHDNNILKNNYYYNRFVAFLNNKKKWLRKHTSFFDKAQFRIFTNRETMSCPRFGHAFPSGLDLVFVVVDGTTRRSVPPLLLTACRFSTLYEFPSSIVILLDIHDRLTKQNNEIERALIMDDNQHMAYVTYWRAVDRPKDCLLGKPLPDVRGKGHGHTDAGFVVSYGSIPFRFNPENNIHSKKDTSMCFWEFLNRWVPRLQVSDIREGTGEALFEIWRTQQYDDTDWSRLVFTRPHKMIRAESTNPLTSKEKKGDRSKQMTKPKWRTETRTLNTTTVGQPVCVPRCFECPTVCR